MKLGKPSDAPEAATGKAPRIGVDELLPQLHGEIVTVARPGARSGELREEGRLRVIGHRLDLVGSSRVRRGVGPEGSRTQFEDEDVPTGDPPVTKPGTAPPQVQSIRDARRDPRHDGRLPVHRRRVEVVPCVRTAVPRLSRPEMLQGIPTAGPHDEVRGRAHQVRRAQLREAVLRGCVEDDVGSRAKVERGGHQSLNPHL